MTVSRILAAKGRDVVTVAPDCILQDVAHLLSAKSIGAVVVCNGSGSVLGIFSERDLVHAIAERGAQALDDSVARHMTEQVETADEQTTVPGLMQKMTSGRFRHVPVVENGRLAGLVSIGDVVKRRVEEYEAEQQALKEYIANA
jgi:CBS domain-containing protein